MADTGESPPRVSSRTDVVLAKSEITATTPSAIPPMPAAFETLLGEQEFFDMLEHLRSPVQ